MKNSLEALCLQQEERILQQEKQIQALLQELCQLRELITNQEEA